MTQAYGKAVGEMCSFVQPNGSACPRRAAYQVEDQLACGHHVVKLVDLLSPQVAATEGEPWVRVTSLAIAATQGSLPDDSVRSTEARFREIAREEARKEFRAALSHLAPSDRTSES